MLASTQNITRNEGSRPI